MCPRLLEHLVYEENIYENMLCALLLRSKTRAAELFRASNDYASVHLNWSFCVGYAQAELLP